MTFARRPLVLDKQRSVVLRESVAKSQVQRERLCRVQKLVAVLVGSVKIELPRNGSTVLVLQRYLIARRTLRCAVLLSTALRADCAIASPLLAGTGRTSRGLPS